MDNGTPEDRPWLYYKLTNEPKGSGELRKQAKITECCNIIHFALLMPDHQILFCLFVFFFVCGNFGENIQSGEERVLETVALY